MEFACTAPLVRSRFRISRRKPVPVFRVIKQSKIKSTDD